MESSVTAYHFPEIKMLRLTTTTKNKTKIKNLTWRKKLTYLWDYRSQCQEGSYGCGICIRFPAARFLFMLPICHVTVAHLDSGILAC